MSRPKKAIILGGFLVTQIFLPMAYKEASAAIRTEVQEEEVLREFGKDAKVVSAQTPSAPADAGTGEANDPTAEDKPGAVAVKMAY